MQPGTIRTLLIAAALTMAILGLRFGGDIRQWWNHWWAVDACLDAGGGWDREADRCIGDRPGGGATPVDIAR